VTRQLLSDENTSPLNKLRRHPALILLALAAVVFGTAAIVVSFISRTHPASLLLALCGLFFAIAFPLAVNRAR
jgi:fucose permease